MKYQARSKTSYKAAVSAESNADTLRGMIYRYLKNCGKNGATDMEMQDSLGINPSTQRPRRIELVEKGIVADSGVTRPSPSGRNATVWTASAFK